MPMYPPPAPTVANGTDLTVSALLKQPKLIKKRVSDLALRKDPLPLIFADNGLNQAGATQYQQVTQNDILPTNKSEPVAPGAEYPKIAFADPTILVANIAKQGAEFDITEEMRDRDQMGIVDQNIGKLVNRVLVDTQTTAMAVLAAAISSGSRTTSGQNWDTVASTAEASRTAAASVYADLAKMANLSETEGMPYSFDTAILNPAQLTKLMTLAGKDGMAGVLDLFKGFGFNQVWSTSLQTVKTAKFLASKQVGAREWEGTKGVETRTKEAGGEGFTDKTVVNVRERVMTYVTDPYAIFELTGLGS